MSLLKIPFIVAATAAVHIALTPPTTTPPKDEQPAVLTRGNRYVNFMVPKFGYLKAVFWVELFTEIAIILARWSSKSSPMVDVLLTRTAEADLHLAPLSVVGTVLAVGGGLLRLQCYRTLKKYFTFEVAIRKDHQLVTWGPYGIVRHPSYLGFLACYIGMVCYYGAQGGLLRESGAMGTLSGKLVVGFFTVLYGTAVVALLRRMPEEDRLLKGTFGAAWDEWAKKVPYRLIPGIY